MMALEEPETHLHPQAQRALFRQISNMPGQRIISTHSPYICGQAEIAHMRHFSKAGEETVVCQIDAGAGATRLTPEDFRKIDRQVMNTRGDMLFARALVFFEGETEEQALPDFAEQFWREHPNDLGYSFIGVGGCGNYLPFLRMAESFRIPWFIFSDGEAVTVTVVNAALATIGQSVIPNNSRVIVLPIGGTMARIVRIHEYGDPTVLKIEDIEVPPPASGEVQIDVKSIGLNRAEVMFRAHNYPREAQFPSRLGYEA